MFQICVYDNYDQVSQKAFEVILEFVKSGKPVTLGLATGSSPVGMYQRMVKDHETNGTSYQFVTTYNLDEYVGLPKGHSQSYLTFMNENLFDFIDIDPKKVHMPLTHTDKLKEEAAAYSKAVLDAGVDLQVLGVGSNGHIGFNEPGTPFESTTHVVGLKEETRLDNARFFTDLAEVPEYAVSMGITEIMSAKKILLIATGKKKAVAIRSLVKDPISTDSPCTILQKHPDVILVLDKEAASLLDD
jgi:glucosamine-6-phosphate deaminase